MEAMTHAVLQFDWEGVYGKRLNRILGINAVKLKDGLTSYDSVIFFLSDCAVHISVSDDTDELIVSRLELSDRVLVSQTLNEPLSLLDAYIESELGWCWIGTNYRGYKDSFTVSFSGIEPQIMFVGIASTVQIYLLKAM